MNMNMKIEIKEKIAINISEGLWLFYQSRMDIKNKVSELQFLEVIDTFTEFMNMDDEAQVHVLNEIAGGNRTGVAEFKEGDEDFEEIRDLCIKKAEGTLTEEEEEKMRVILLKRVKKGGINGFKAG